jgi:hypothetical protein
LDAVSRRLELLKLEGLGFSQAEIVKELSQKCACSKRTVYTDFETRESWQPIVQSVIDARKVLLKIVNRYEQIYRQASVRLLTFSEEACQLGYTRLKERLWLKPSQVAMVRRKNCQARDMS